MLSSMDSEEDATGYSQRTRLQHRVRGAAERSWLRLSRPVRSGCWRPTCKPCWPTLTAAPRGRRSSTPGAATSSCRCRPSPRSKLYPKEKALIDMVAAERMEGRRVLVYATHTGTRDITERMDDMLTTARVPRSGDEGRRRGPGTAGGVGGGQGETGHRRDDLPPQRLAQTRPGLDRLPNPDAGTKLSSPSFNQQEKVRYSWAVDLEATGAE